MNFLSNMYLINSIIIILLIIIYIKNLNLIFYFEY